MRLRHFISLIVCALALASPAVRAAQASETQQFLMEDERHLLDLSSAEQLRDLQQMEALGVDKIRVAVLWRLYVREPSSSERPPGDPTHADSGLYDPGRMAMLDSLIRRASGMGIAVLLDPAAASGLSGTDLRTPRWAQLAHHVPDPVEYQHFVRALARRYNGHYFVVGDPAPLPAVREWSIWNEPNNRTFLAPQWKNVDGAKVPYAPVLYRRLYTRATHALRSSGHVEDRIYIGETASMGQTKGSENASMAPGLFIRELACLGPDMAPYEEDAARRRGCLGYHELDTDGLTTHFYSPDDGAASADEGATDAKAWPPEDTSRPGEMLERIGAQGALPEDLPVLGTEAGFQAMPPAGSLSEDRGLDVNLAEYLQYRDPSVTSFAQYLLYDDPAWFTGLFDINGRAKPAFAALRMPLIVRDIGGGQASLWGASYGRAAGRLTIIREDGKEVTRVTPTNVRGYFEVTVPLNGPDATFQIRDRRTGTGSRRAAISPGI